MSTQEISVRIRAGLWRAYECRCFYCQIPIPLLFLAHKHSNIVHAPNPKNPSP